MGIQAAITAIKDAWFTLSTDGLPEYRRNADGSRISNIMMAQYANETSNKYNVVVEQHNPYIEPDRAPLAYA